MKSFLEISLKLKGFPVKNAAEEILRIQSFTKEEFIQWQENKKREIVDYHFKNNEFYKSKIGNSVPEKWEDLPILTKSDYQHSEKKLISKTIVKNDLYTGYTSGSSGHPFHYAKDKFAHAMTWALIKDRYKNFGLTLKSKQARFYGIPFERMDYIIERTKDFLSNRKRFPVFDLSDEMLGRFLNEFKRIKFEYVYGYTNSIVLFARYIIKNKFILKDICPTLKVCICTSENCTEEDKEIIFKAFNIPVVNEYGTSEVDLIAFEDFSGQWRLSEENVFMEILDEQGKRLTQGGEGRIILTALHNKAMPFIRYEIGDRAVIEPDEKKIKIKKLMGGVNDIVKLPSGKQSSGVTFYFITRDVLEKSGVLKEFIIRQVSINKFIIDIVSTGEISNNEIKKLQRKMDMYLEPGLEIEINRVEKIERTKAGKMKHFHSGIN